MAASREPATRPTPRARPSPASRKEEAFRVVGATSKARGGQLQRRTGNPPRAFDTRDRRADVPQSPPSEEPISASPNAEADACEWLMNRPESPRPAGL